MNRNAIRKATISCVVDIAVWMAVLMVVAAIDGERSFGEVLLSPVNLILMAAGIIGGTVYVYINEARSGRGGKKSRAKKR